MKIPLTIIFTWPFAKFSHFGYTCADVCLKSINYQYGFDLTFICYQKKIPESLSTSIMTYINTKYYSLSDKVAD